MRSNNPFLTGPGAAVQFDSHADVFRMSAIGHEANSARDQWRVYLTQFRHVRVNVPLDYLHRNQQRHPYELCFFIFSYFGLTALELDDIRSN